MEVKCNCMEVKCHCMEIKANCMEAKINVQKTPLYRKVKGHYKKKGCSEIKVKE